MYNSGRRGRRANDGYGILSQADTFNQREYPIPVINSFAVTDGSYVPLDDTAVNTAGGQTIVLYGSGFAPGATVTVGGVTIGAVTYLDQGRLTFTSPANSSGSYTVVVINASGGAGILVPGLVYSGVPTWSTSAGSVGSSYERTNVSSTFVATGDAPMTYSVLSGSLPPGTSLSTTGVLSGTAPVESGSTTYSFTIRATDGELQDTDRSFSLTINTDVVTMSSPTNNQVISSYEYTAISNVTVAGTSAAGFGVVYSANTVPTGITLNANTGIISGTANTVGNTFTRLTATANSTNRTATRDVVFNVNQDVVTWNSPVNGTAYSLAGGSTISPVTLSATSAAGFGVQYSANALPSGLTLSGSTISGTPDTSQTVNTLLTATANTTGRSATRTISWSISLGDIYWKYVSLLLNATTPTPNFINDASLNNVQLTIVGDTKPNNFTPYEEGYYSNFFDGTSDYLTAPGPFSGTGPYTVEFWIYRTAAPGTTRILERGTTSTDFSIDMTTAGVMTVNNSAAVSGSTCTIAVTLNTWTHVALVRTSTGTNDTRWYINGVAAGAFTHTTSFSSGGTLQIGRAAVGSSLLTGYLSNLRVVMGSAVYTSAFTPPTGALTAVANTKLLTCQSNNFIDNSANNNTITKTGDVTVTGFVPFPTTTTVPYNTQYSTTFNGSSDYLSLTSQANLALGSGDFTVEMWLYTKLASLPLNATLYDQRNGTNGSGVTQPVTELTSASGYTWYVNAVNAITSGAAAVRLYQWQHLAISKVSGSTRMYVDGVQVGSTFSDSKNYPAGSTFIGRANDGSSTRFYTGHISNLRVLVGTGLYSGTTITVPTSPLTTVANTQLLTCQDPTLIDKSTNAFTITSVSGPRPVAISPFTMTTANTVVAPLGSTYFDGTGDYLTLPSGSSSLSMGTGNFTVEMYVYITSLAATRKLYDTLNSGDSTGTGRMFIQVSTGGAVQFGTGFGAGSGIVNTSGGTLIVNTWYHIAVTKSNNNVRIFVNGVQVNTTFSDSVTYTVGTVNRPVIGIEGYDNSSNPMLGYIADLRVVKGTALYTSNFLPPQAPLTAVANTVLLTCQTNGSVTNNIFIDQSSFNVAPITRFGNVTQGTFSPYSQTGWSNYFDGTGDYLSLPSSSNLLMGTGNFTIEYWINVDNAPLTDDSYICHFSYGTTGNVLRVFNRYANASGWQFDVWVGASNIIRVNNSSTINTWAHVALVRSGTTLTAYINGVSMNSLTNSTDYNTGTLTIGSSSTLYMKGYISNFRIIKGTALYTTAFTPPTAPLSAVANTQLLTCADNRFIDESPNNFTITRNGDVAVQALSPFGGVTSVPTSYSNYFDGTGDYLSLTGTTPIQFGSDNFTIECWLWTSSTNAGTFYGDRSGANFSGMVISIQGSKVTLLMTQGSSWNINTYSAPTGSNITLNAWNHVAITRSGTTIYVFINGVQSYTSTFSGTLAQSSTVRIGAEAGDTITYTGYISNFRMVKGTALYTSNFTVPTSPLTAVQNTGILTCQSNAMIDNSTNAYSLTATGDTKVYTFNPFGLTNTTGVAYSPSGNGGSMYFDGSGDYLRIPADANISGTGYSWTIQGWVYPLGTTGGIIDGWNGGAGTSMLLRLSGGSLEFYITGASSISSPASLTTGRWYHFAVVKNVSNSNTISLYIDGVRVGTPIANYTTSVTSNIFGIGGSTSVANPGSEGLTGYISDLQIIKGAALYTANFWPGYAPATPTTRIDANTAASTLFLSGTSGGIIDAHGTNILENVGDVKLAPEDAYSGSYYSNYFDGVGDYLACAINNSSLTDWYSQSTTIEAWIFPTSSVNYTNNYPSVLTNASPSSSTNYWAFGINGLNLRFAYFNGSGQSVQSTGTVSLNTWTHIAFVYNNSDSSIKLFINGVLDGSATKSGTPQRDAALGVSFGGWNGGGFAGYISNLRVLIGTALYTSAFTPPTSPLTAISGTSLLTCQSNSLRDNSTNAFTITRNGDVAVKSFNPFKRNTGQSIYFDGTDDYLSITHNPSQQLGTGDFTAEGWFMPMPGKTDGVTCFYIKGINTSGGIILGVGSSYIFMRHTGTTDIYSPDYSNNMRNQWVHVAWVRSGSTVTIYRNGVSVATGTVSMNQNDSSIVYIGSYTGITNSSNRFGGHVLDFRITKGVARYTTSFTPPTTRFEDK